MIELSRFYSIIGRLERSSCLMGCSLLGVIKVPPSSSPMLVSSTLRPFGVGLTLCLGQALLASSPCCSQMLPLGRCKRLSATRC